MLGLEKYRYMIYSTIGLLFPLTAGSQRFTLDLPIRGETRSTNWCGIGQKKLPINTTSPFAGATRITLTHLLTTIRLRYTVVTDSHTRRLFLQP